MHPAGEVGQSLNRHYAAPLDYLRALAAITVVVYHGLIAYRSWTFPGVLTGAGAWHFEGWPHSWNPIVDYFVEGHTAVTLFMVLSGYVLTRGVVGRDVAYWPFLKNRLLRIYPLYLFLTMFGISLHPANFTLAGLLQLILPFANNPGSFQSEVTTTLFWTVAVEFQFYLIFPFLIRFIEDYGLRYIFGVVAMMMVFESIAIFYVVDIHDFAYYTIFGRLSQFLIGMAAAYATPPRWMRSRAALPIAGLTILALLTLFNQYGGYPSQSFWKLYWPVAEAAAWGFVIMASIETPYRMPKYARVVLAAIANMSFSIYLLHSTIYQIIGEHRWFGHPLHQAYANAFLCSALVLPLVLAISAMTYLLIEKPFMGLRVRYVRLRGDAVA